MRPALPERSRSVHAIHRGLRLAALCVASVSTSSCGGPSVPAEVPSTSPLSTHAEPAPLPTIGSSFVDTPLSPDEPSGGHAGHDVHGHAGHAGHGGPTTETPDADGAPEDAAISEPADAGAPAHPHGGHEHAH